LPARTASATHPAPIYGLSSAEAIKGKIKTLLVIAEKELHAQKQVALKAESDFFTSHGLPTERTTVSRQFDAAVAQLAVIREGIEPRPNTSNDYGIWQFSPTCILGPILG